MRYIFVGWQIFLHVVFGIRPAFLPTQKTIYRWYAPLPWMPPFWVIVGTRWSDGREYRLPEIEADKAISYRCTGWRPPA